MLQFKNVCRYILLLMSIWAMPNTLVFARAGKDSIKINCTVHWDQKVGDEKGKAGIQVCLSMYPFTLSEMARLHPIVFKDGKYKNGESFSYHFTLPSCATYCYMNIIAVFPGQWRNPFYNFKNIYILKKGDSVNCEVKYGNIVFTGKGASRLNCQSQIFAHWINGNVTPDLVNTGQYARAIDWEKMSYDTLLKKRLHVLDGYKNRIGNDAYGLIKANCIADRYFEWLHSTRLTLAAQGTESPLGSNIMENYFYHYFRRGQDSLFNGIPSTLLENTPLYANYLFERNYMDVQVTENLRRENRRPPFKSFYDAIRDKYTGKVKDQTLILAFLILRHARPDASLYLEDAIHKVSFPLYGNILLDIKRKEGKGEDFFKFTLVDSAGKKYFLHSFSGKLVIMDFWYTGCENCISLRKSMQPIFDLFSKNSNVVFVSVSIDRDIKQWKRSLINGLYTDSSEINLYTNGDGEGDPLIRYYGITAYPRQLIFIDGKIYEPNPPAPSVWGKDGVKQGSATPYINILEEGLKLLN